MEKMMEKRRVVITGMGAVTPIGNNVETFWKNVKGGKNGIGSKKRTIIIPKSQTVITATAWFIRSYRLRTEKSCKRT